MARKGTETGGPAETKAAKFSRLASARVTRAAALAAMSKCFARAMCSSEQQFHQSLLSSSVFSFEQEVCDEIDPRAVAGPREASGMYANR
jgi:hypothetical protein